MKLGLDCVAAPTFPQLQAMIGQSGATWLCAYIGGPTALGTGWTADVHRALSPLLADGFLPTYAGVGWGGPFTALRGTQDGQDALDLLQAAGFDADGCPLVLDLEAAAYSAGAGNGIDIYCQAWADTVRAEGAVPVLYSSVAGCAALGGLFAHVWRAWWVDTGTGALSRPPASDGHTYWQYASNVVVAGVPCDANVAADDAPFARPLGTQPEPVTVDTAWLGKKQDVVEAAGREQERMNQLEAERNRSYVRKTVLDQIIAGGRADMGAILQ